jgi:cytoskeletal protein RodZ
MSGLLLAASLVMSVSAHAGGWDWRAAQRQQQQHAAQQQQDKQAKAEQAAKQTKKLADDNKERTERLLKQDSAKSASPFVRASRINAAWDNRGLGVATRESTIRPGTSIYQRLHTAPQSLTSSLHRAYQMSFIHSMLLKRTEQNPLATLDLRRVTNSEIALLRVAGEQERRHEYDRNRPSRSVFAMLRVR